MTLLKKIQMEKSHI